MKEPILIVDDDDMNLMIMEECLSDDHELISARDGEQAIAQVREHAPSLILMDIMMPGMDGYEACRQIKESPLGETTHVILVSARASAEERVRGYEVGADDYVVKPFDHEELKAKVRVQLRLRQTLHELAKARAKIACENRGLEDDVLDKQREIVDTRDMVVFALARLADSRDPETGEHLSRIRRYCLVLSEYLQRHGPYTHQIDDAFPDAIYRASPLHDIGKVGVPDAILLKPGRLTPDEFAQMQRHCNIGAEALREVAAQSPDGSFLEMAIQIAQSHHEKWDGSGYPHGLRGEQIPLAARITAVADVFDALTTARVYKPPFSIEQARQIIVSDAGGHFDPVVVEAFEACFDAFVETHRELDSVGDGGSTEAA